MITEWEVWCEERLDPTLRTAATKVPVATAGEALNATIGTFGGTFQDRIYRMRPSAGFIPLTEKPQSAQ